MRTEGSRKRWVLSDSAVASSGVDGDVQSAGKERAALAVSAVLTEQEDGVLPDSAGVIRGVDADVHSAGKEQAALPFSEVVTSAAGGGTAALHVAGSSPASKCKEAHAGGRLSKARKVDLVAYTNRR